MTKVANIRVLVAEDSPTARALLVSMLSETPGLEVIGEATNGIDAVEFTKRLRPDVVTMDIQMPRLDGFEATKRIMIATPTPIVIVSSLDVHSVSFSMEALNAGALAVLPKPVGPTSPGYDQACRTVAATVRSMSQVRLVRRWPSNAPPRPSQISSPSVRAVSQSVPARSLAPSWSATVVTMAASTGGPAALHKLFAQLPKDFPVPILFVQHIALGFANGFARWLNDASEMHIKVAVAGEPLLAGTAYLAPDDRHLGVSVQGTVLLSGSPPVGGFRPSASFLFDSAARTFGSATLGVILTGMGTDGIDGLHTLKDLGGRIIAQDEETSDIFGMPATAINAGLADMVLPLGSIAGQVRRWTRKS